MFFPLLRAGRTVQVKMKQAEFDAMLRGVGTIAKLEASRAVAPLIERIVALEFENKALRAAMAQDSNLSVADFVARYSALA